MTKFTRLLNALMQHLRAYPAVICVTERMYSRSLTLPKYRKLKMLKQQELIRGLTNYHWLPDLKAVA